MNELTTTPRPELVAGGPVAAIIPRTFDEMFRFANLIVKSGFAPKGMSAEEVTGAIAKGLEVGMAPMQAVQNIAVINGRPTIWGDGLAALVHSSGLMTDLKEWIEGENEGMIAFCVVRRDGVETPIKRSFSVDDAKKARLWGKQGPWQSYPTRMLQMRARSWAFRDAFADVLNGLYVREEVRDYEPIKTVQVREETTQQLLEQAKVEDAVIEEEQKFELFGPDGSLGSFLAPGYVKALMAMVEKNDDCQAIYNDNKENIGPAFAVAEVPIIDLMTLLNERGVNLE